MPVVDVPETVPPRARGPGGQPSSWSRTCDSCAPICSAVRLTEAIASALATEQVGEKGEYGDHAQHVEQSRVAVERVHDHVDVSTEVVGAKAPDRGPEDGAGDIVYGEDPPR